MKLICKKSIKIETKDFIEVCKSNAIDLWTELLWKYSAIIIELKYFYTHPKKVFVNFIQFQVGFPQYVIEVINSIQH